MIENLLFFVAVVVAYVIGLWCERKFTMTLVESLQDELAAERSTVSRQMVELAKVKDGATHETEHLLDCCMQITKERDQLKKKLDEAIEDFDVEGETSFYLRHSRAIIIDHCRKLKRELSHERATHKLTLDAARDMANKMKEERDHARKLMDETRERCGQEVDTLQRHKNMFESRINQLLAEKHRLSIGGMGLRQSRQRIIDHCRMLNRKHKEFVSVAEYMCNQMNLHHMLSRKP